MPLLTILTACISGVSRACYDQSLSLVCPDAPLRFYYSATNGPFFWNRTWPTVSAEVRLKKIDASFLFGIVHGRLKGDHNRVLWHSQPGRFHDIESFAYVTHSIKESFCNRKMCFDILSTLHLYACVCVDTLV